MILTDPQNATLAARLAQPDCAGLSDRAASDLLSAPAVATPTVPAPFTAVSLLGAVDPARRPGLAPYLGDLAPHVAAQDRAGLAGWAAVLAAFGVLQAADVAALGVLLSATAAGAPEPAPSWAASAFPGARFAMPNGQVVEGMVTPEMIAEARS